MTDQELLEAFEAATIDKADWDHRAHLRVAYLYLSDGSVEAALPRLRHHLKQLLVAFAIEDGPTVGFHETITVAWLRVVASAMKAHGPYASFDALLEGHPYLLDKRLMRLFYTRECLMSAAAKAGFVEGDLTSLP